MMPKKTYGLVYRKGRWHVKNYGRVLKSGGLYWIQATVAAWWKNRTGETPPIKVNLRRKKPKTFQDLLDSGKDEFESGGKTFKMEPGDLVAQMDTDINCLVGRVAKEDMKGITE